MQARTWFLIGLVLACLFTTPANGAERWSSVPVGNGDPIDERFIPAGVDRGHQFVLTKRDESCTGGGRRAYFLQHPGVVIPGCWRAKGAEVEMLFEDNDTIKLPIAAFIWLPGQRPTTS